MEGQGRTLGVLIAAAALALVATKAHADCPPAPPPVRHLNLTRFYADKAGSVVDPSKMDIHKEETAPLTQFVGFVAKEADRSWRQGSRAEDASACALTWLKVWAKGNAYLGTMATEQSQSQRKWDLAGTALAYLKIRAHATSDDRAIIEPWLIRWADAARAVFDSPNIKRNNHWYWLGLALGAVGIATDSERHWQAAKGIMADAAGDVTADGTLPLEMAREGRALYYHAFAAMPLVALAELGAARGEDWYGLNGGALHRLVAKTTEGLADPAIFDTLGGAPQERPIKSGAGWIYLYRTRFAGKLVTDVTQPESHRWLGGDVAILRRVLAAAH